MLFYLFAIKLKDQALCLIAACGAANITGSFTSYITLLYHLLVIGMLISVSLIRIFEGYVHGDLLDPDKVDH